LLAEISGTDPNRFVITIYKLQVQIYKYN